MRKVRPAAGLAALLLLWPWPTAGATERFEELVPFGTGPGNERVFDMARDSAGNTFVVGYTFGAFPGSTSEGEVDGYVAKLSPSGALLWADQFGGADDNGENGFYAVAVDPDGAAYVTGVTQQDLHAPVRGYSDVVVRKYSPDGTVVWGDQYSGTEDLEAGFGIAVSASQVHVVGSSAGTGFLRTYSSTGSLLSAQQEVGTDLWDVATAGDDVYVLGTERSEDGGRGFVRRTGPVGTREVPFAGWAEPMRLAVSDTAVAATGMTWGDTADTVVAQWTRDLVPGWTSTGNVDPSCGCGQPVWALALGPAGDVFAAGGADGPDGFVRKHDASTGEPAWEVQLEAAGWGVGGIAVEGDRVVFATASGSGTGAFVASWSTTRTVPLTRLAGPDRVGTAIAVSRAAFPEGAPGAVLVSARSFADGIVAGPVAAMVGGPVLLVGADLGAVGDELQRLLEPPATVTIVGGPGAVSVDVESAVRSSGFEVERIAGATRFDTAVAAARLLGSPPAILADGLRFPDALVAGAAAIQSGQAVILTAGAALPAVSREYLLDVGAGHVAVGGPAALAAPGAETIVGTDRYDTANRVVSRFFGVPHVVGVASGADFADALALVPLLGAQGAPVLLTPPSALAAQTADHLGLHLLEVYVAGGTAAVSPAVAQQMSELLVEGGPFELRSSPQFVQRLFPGHRPLALVTASGEPGVAIELLATVVPSGASVEIEPAVIQPGGVAEVWIDVPAVVDDVPISVTITGHRDGVARTTTVAATATPGVDDLQPTALDIADVFLEELAGQVPGLPTDRAGLTEGTPVAGLLVVSHYAWFTEDLEIGLSWHIMVAPDDWAELYVRPRDALAPTQAFRLSSWSTALSGGAYTVTEVPPPPEVVR